MRARYRNEAHLSINRDGNARVSVARWWRTRTYIHTWRTCTHAETKLGLCQPASLTFGWKAPPLIPPFNPHHLLPGGLAKVKRRNARVCSHLLERVHRDASRALDGALSTSETNTSNNMYLTSAVLNSVTTASSEARIPDVSFMTAQK